MVVEQKVHTSYVLRFLLWDNSNTWACRHRPYFLLHSSSHAEPEWGIFIHIYIYTSSSADHFKFVFTPLYFFMRFVQDTDYLWHYHSLLFP